jgi:hypothetical protein
MENQDELSIREQLLAEMSIDGDLLSPTTSISSTDDDENDKDDKQKEEDDAVYVILSRTNFLSYRDETFKHVSVTGPELYDALQFDEWHTRCYNRKICRLYGNHDNTPYASCPFSGVGGGGMSSLARHLHPWRFPVMKDLNSEFRLESIYKMMNLFYNKRFDVSKRRLQAEQSSLSLTRAVRCKHGDNCKCVAFLYVHAHEKMMKLLDEEIGNAIKVLDERGNPLRHHEKWIHVSFENVPEYQDLTRIQRARLLALMAFHVRLYLCLHAQAVPEYVDKLSVRVSPIAKEDWAENLHS